MRATQAALLQVLVTDFFPCSVFCTVWMQITQATSLQMPRKDPLRPMMDIIEAMVGHTTPLWHVLRGVVWDGLFEIVMDSLWKLLRGLLLPFHV